MTHPARILIASLVVFPFIFACGKRQTAATLNDVETYIQARPDSALATIRAIDTTTLTVPKRWSSSTALPNRWPSTRSIRPDSK